MVRGFAPVYTAPSPAAYAAPQNNLSLALPERFLYDAGKNL
jgi:hypothetical protein